MTIEDFEVCGTVNSSYQTNSKVQTDERWKGEDLGGEIQALAQSITYNNVRKSENLKIRRKFKRLTYYSISTRTYSQRSSLITTYLKSGARYPGLFWNLEPVTYVWLKSLSNRWNWNPKRSALVEPGTQELWSKWS